MPISNQILLIVFFFSTFAQSYAQELNCRVQVTHSQIQTTNTKLFETMQKDINEFINNQKWTEHIFAPEEKVECNILINITQQIGSNKFVSTLQIQSRRPVYQSNFYSSMLNLQERKEDFRFEYVEGQPLIYSQNSFISNLTSVLAFYAYIVIGLDYDSFSKFGGNVYFQKAQNIVNMAQSSGNAGTGWQAQESQQNRYWLSENLNNEVYKPIREFIYRSHRLGYDELANNLEKGRAEITESLKLLQQAHRKKPNSYLMEVYFNAKADEMIQLFKEGQAFEKKQAYNILREVNPPNATRYEELSKE